MKKSLCRRLYSLLESQLLKSRIDLENLILQQVNRVLRKTLDEKEN